jgi:hypothetical protein
MPKRQPEPEKITLEDVEEHVMEALERQTNELCVYASTPHTQENQARILSTLKILARIKELQHGNS